MLDKDDRRLDTLGIVFLVCLLFGPWWSACLMLIILIVYSSVMQRISDRKKEEIFAKEHPEEYAAQHIMIARWKMKEIEKAAFEEEQALLEHRRVIAEFEKKCIKSPL